MKKRAMLASAIALVGLPLMASAQFSAPGVGLGPIPDGTGTGTSGAPLVSTATIGGSGPIANVWIDFGQGGITHTWVGDLWITLTHPNGTTTMDILKRPGRGSASTFGYSSDFVVGNSYVFRDGGATLFNVAPAAIIPSGTYLASSNPATAGDPSPPPQAYVYTPMSFVSTFGGLEANGVWTLTITDWGGGDIGALNGWTLHVDVPEPTSLALIGLAGLGLLARRRHV
jgi:subtilisin-like proprotein convertase family protein